MNVKTIETLLPVFFMIGLGVLCRKKQWINTQEKDGIKKIIFGVLLPVVIFNALFTSDINISMLFTSAYALVAWVIAFIIGYLLRNWVSKRYSKVVAHMMWVAEGGGVALPLYSSIVGSQYTVNTVVFDIAGIIICFVLIPIIVSTQSSSKCSGKEMAKNIFTNSFVLALLFGSLLNFLGVYDLLEKLNIKSIYDATISMATASVGSLIIFAIGYEMKIEKYTIGPIIRLIILRIVTSLMIIAGVYIFIPSLMANNITKIAVLIYFMCPTGFANQFQVEPLYEDESDGTFLSTYMSLYMFVTLIAYVLIVALFA